MKELEQRQADRDAAAALEDLENQRAALAAERAKLEQDKDVGGKMAKGLAIGKYKVSGDTIELTASEKAAGLFGSKDKDKETAKLKIDGDTMTITTADSTVKLARVK